jgi:hypothetical protein
MQTSISKAIAAVKRDGPTVNILHTSLAGNGLAKVVVQVVHSGDSRTNKQSILASIGRKTNNKLKAVSGTFRKVESSSVSDTLVGLMSVNRECRPYTEQAVSGFKSVSSNMFMDGEQDMWRLEETAGGKILVKENAAERVESMRELLSSISSANPYRGNVKLSAQGGDFVAYVGLSGEPQYGFVVASLVDEENLLVAPIEGEPVEISEESLTEVVTGDQLEDEGEQDAEAMIVSASSSVGVEQLISYYRRMYGRRPEFFAALVARIRGNCYA